ESSHPSANTARAHTATAHRAAVRSQTRSHSRRICAAPLQPSPPTFHSRETHARARNTQWQLAASWLFHHNLQIQPCVFTNAEPQQRVSQLLARATGRTRHAFPLEQYFSANHFEKIRYLPRRHQMHRVKIRFVFAFQH